MSQGNSMRFVLMKLIFIFVPYYNDQNYLHWHGIGVTVIILLLYCKFKKSFSAQKCQMSFAVSRDNSGHHGAILIIWCLIQPSLEARTVHRGNQFTLRCISAPRIRTVMVYRAVSTLTFRVKTTPILKD